MLPISNFALTCSGNGNVGRPPVYASVLTPLKAKAMVPCASWGPAATVKLNFSFALFLYLQGTPPDTYSASGFTVIATST